jgi:putative transposase
VEKSGVNKGYHCAWQIHYHIVFPVKYRKLLLDGEVVRIIRQTAIGIEQRYATDIEAMGMDKDHIHLLCAVHPKISPGQIVRVFKSITAREIFRANPRVKKQLWGGEFWTDGHCVATVGERGDWKTVERYVERQGSSKEDLKQLKLF